MIVNSFFLRKLVSYVYVDVAEKPTYANTGTWDWYIYLHLPKFTIKRNQPSHVVGKCTIH